MKSKDTLLLERSYEQILLNEGILSSIFEPLKNKLIEKLKEAFEHLKEQNPEKAQEIYNLLKNKDVEGLKNQFGQLKVQEKIDQLFSKQNVVVKEEASSVLDKAKSFFNVIYNILGTMGQTLGMSQTWQGALVWLLIIIGLIMGGFWLTLNDPWSIDTSLFFEPSVLISQSFENQGVVGQVLMTIGSIVAPLYAAAGNKQLGKKLFAEK